MSKKILIVEDESKITRTLSLYLERAGYSAAAVHDGAHAISAFRRLQPDLILLDLNLPGVDGLDICRELRRHSDVPIIMITARIEETDRLIGLELGADDYILKPFSPREVVARVRAVLRRAPREHASGIILQAGELRIDVEAHRAWLGQDAIALTHTEFELLAVLAGHSGLVMTRLQLLDRMAGVAFEGYERTIDQHIKNVRRKLREAGGRAEIIQTVYGVGYRMDPASKTRGDGMADVPW
jgi:DNA-binding response OmpR family regulator